MTIGEILKDALRTSQVLESHVRRFAEAASDIPECCPGCQEKMYVALHQSATNILRVAALLGDDVFALKQLVPPGCEDYWAVIAQQRRLEQLSKVFLPALRRYEKHRSAYLQGMN